MKLFAAFLLAALALGAARADLLPLADEAALNLWSKKKNTALARSQDGALVMEVRTGEFNFGWMQRPLPAKAASPEAAGVCGRYRSAPESRAQLTVTLILKSGGEPRFYSCSQGNVSDSRGEWIEFYAPLTAFRPERDAKPPNLKASEVREGDALQLSLSNVSGANAAAAFDRLRFLDKTEAEVVGHAIQRAALARSLLPAARSAGAPHPRLLLSPERLARVRAKATAGGDAQAAYAALLAHAERFLLTHNAANPFEQVLNFQPDGEVTAHQRSAQLEGRFTAAAIPIEVLAAAYRITGEKRYGEHAAKALVSAARSLDAGNAVLNSGFYYTRTFYVRALAFGYDWLWPLLTPEERAEVKTTLLGFVLQIHADSWTATWGRRPLHRVWNWDPGLVSCAGLGMLALEGETTTAEKAILFDLRRHLRDYLTLGIDADGAGHEGPGYLAYGIGAGPEFAECLREQGRGDLFTETNWQLIPSWLVAETLPDRLRWNNLSDCGHGQSAASVYSYTCGRLAELARHAAAAAPDERLPAPETLLAAKDYLWQFAEAPGPRRLSYPALASLMGWEWQGSLSSKIAKGSAPVVLACLLFHEPCPSAPDPAARLPDAQHFRGRGLAVSRTGYDTNAVYFAVEAGPHAAGHDQADKGSFTLYGYGADLAIDSGYGNDGEPLKSGGSHAHNMVLINGQGQPLHWHNQSSGHITGYHHSGLLDWVRVDAREAWNTRYDSEWRPQPAAEPVEKALRHFLFVRGSAKNPPYLVVMDDLRKDGQPADYTWLWHIPNSLRFQCSADRWTAAPLRLAGPLLTSSPGQTRGGARFTFTAPSNGVYALAGLVRAGGTDAGKSDSFWLSANNGKRLLWDLSGKRAFGWETLATRDPGSTNAFALRAGAALTVEVQVREAEAQLSKLALLPQGAELPAAPDANPAAGVTLTADDAQLLTPPLLRQPVPPSGSANARLTVFPVTTDARLATNGWFATSREGTHPRLEHTVRAIEPRFLMVLVPGNAGTPLPQVRRLALENGAGAEVVWDGATDQFVFGEGEVRANGTETDGRAAFVRREAGLVTGWALLDGTWLTADGKERVKRSPNRVAAGSCSPF
jgi:hypothetical protein